MKKYIVLSRAHSPWIPPTEVVAESEEEALFKVLAANGRARYTAIKPKRERDFNSFTGMTARFCWNPEAGLEGFPNTGAAKDGEWINIREVGATPTFAETLANY